MEGNEIKGLVEAITALKSQIATDVKGQEAKIVELKGLLEKQGEAGTAALKRIEAAEKSVDDMKKAHLAMQAKRDQRLQRSASGEVEVSDDCAKFLTGLVITAGARQGKLGNRQAQLLDLSKGILGEDVQKTALTGSDIVLPPEYGRQLSELVDVYGNARKFGTVYPLTAASTLLPKLKTDPAFGLLTIATAVTEKSPQIENVTFTPQKWGGMVRIPSEIDADAQIALGQFLARYAARQMALIEDTVFFVADGSGTYAALSGVFKQAATLTKLLTMGTGKTKVADVSLTNLRDLRSQVDNAALNRSAYYLHPSLESKLCGFNTESKVQVYVPNGANGATLDGFPVRWVNVLPTVNNTTAETVFGGFGDMSFHYLGVRAGMSLATSVEAGFETDEILVRALERFTTGLMANGAVAAIKTAES